MVNSSTPQPFETDINTFLARTAERELVRRSPPGAILYFVAFLLTVLTTPYMSDRPLFVLLVGALTLVLGSVRGWRRARQRRWPPNTFSAGARFL